MTPAELLQWLHERASDDGSGCLIWTRAVRAGSLTPMARMGGETRPVRRAAWECLHGRKMRRGYRAMSSCGNPLCVLPGHIVTMDHAASCRALADQGRWIDHYAPDTRRRILEAARRREGVMRDDEIERIRAMGAQGITHAQIARDLGRSHSTIARVLHATARAQHYNGASAFDWRP